MAGKVSNQAIPELTGRYNVSAVLIRHDYVGHLQNANKAKQADFHTLNFGLLDGSSDANGGPKLQFLYFLLTKQQNNIS